MILFPILKFWKLTPKQFAARVFWNTFEILHIPCPFAPHVFGIIIGRKHIKENDHDA